MMKKDQHMKYALECEYLDSLNSVKLRYVSLPSINIQDVDISTKFCGMDFKYPFFVNAMTGGSKKADEINKRLENICTTLHIFLFTGSFSPALKEDTFYYPKNMGVNIGADKKLDDMQMAIEKTNAKILQIHLNPIQEFMMENGTTNFSDWSNNIKAAIDNISIPLIIKETGFGMSSNTIEKLLKLGVKTIDISSKGGTDFSYIEDRRRNTKREYLYEFGYTLRESLLTSIPYMDRLEVIASGGINNPMQIVKCLAMGAKAVGVTGFILKQLEEKSDHEIIRMLRSWISEIQAIICMTDSKNLEELKGKWEDKKC